MLDHAFLGFEVCFWAIRDSLTSGSSALGNAMSKLRDVLQKGLLLPALDQIIGMGHRRRSWRR